PVELHAIDDIYPAGSDGGQECVEPRPVLLGSRDAVVHILGGPPASGRGEGVERLELRRWRLVARADPRVQGGARLALASLGTRQGAAVPVAAGVWYGGTAHGPRPPRKARVVGHGPGCSQHRRATLPLRSQSMPERYGLSMGYCRAL